MCPGCANAKPSSDTHGELSDCTKGVGGDTIDNGQSLSMGAAFKNVHLASALIEVGKKQQQTRKLPGTSQKHRQRQLDKNPVATAGAEKSMSTAKGGRKKKQTSQDITSVAVGERRCSSSSSTNCRVADIHNNEFVGKLVAFNCNTKYSKDLIASFGNKFTLQAVCMELNTDYRHLVGVVMRKSKVSGRKGTISDSNDVAWEFSALGESSLPSVVLVNATIAGSQVQQFQSLQSGTQELLDDFVSVRESIAVGRPKCQPKGSKNSSLMNKIRQSL
jgi:hypothetical protein